MPSFFSKLLGKKKHSDNSGLLDGERYEAVPADTPSQPLSGPVPENIPPTKSTSHKHKGHGLGLHLKRRAQSPPPPTEREPISPAPHLSLDLPSSQAEEKKPADLNLGLGSESTSFDDVTLSQKRLTPAETLYLVQKTSEIIMERGLEVLGVMRPHWFASPNHQEAQLKLLNCFLQSLAVRSSNEGPSSSLPSEDPFENELRYTRDPHDVAAVFRWGLRHLQLENNTFALTTVEDWYKTFVTSERSEGYPSQAFDQILPPLLPASHANIIRSVLDLVTSLAAHSEENGISGNKLSKALGWWLISSRNLVKEPQWPSFYSDWEAAARQFEHLFLAYIRTQESQSRMPKRLTELVKNYPYERNRKSEDGTFLPRPRFSTRTTDALFIRIAVQADGENSIVHPLRIVIDSLNSTPGKDASGDYLAIWESIREAAKTSTEEENQDTPSTRFNLSAVIADESLRILSLIPGMNDIPDVSVFPSFASRRSFSLIERPLSLVSTSDQKSPADKANSILTPNMDFDQVTDWQAFSTTGFRSPSGISLSASLWDNDVEITTPSMRPGNPRHTFSSASEPPLPEEPTTPPLRSSLAGEPATMPVEVSNSRVATFSSPSLVKLDEAFVDFWADTLLDSVGQSWPTFVVCQLKPMPNLKVKDTNKSIEWIVIEQVVAIPAPPVKEAVAEPLPASPPVPSTPPKSDTHKSLGFFSLSPTRKRWSLFSSKHDTAPLLGRRRSGSKVSEMGEVLKEEDETPKPPSDVSITAQSQSEESSSAVTSVSKPLEPVVELPKSEEPEPVSEEHPKVDQLTPIPEDVKLEEATATGIVVEKPTEAETAIPEDLPPVPSKVEAEEVAPEVPSKEKELPEPVVQDQVEEGETLADSRIESDAVVVDDAVPLGESAVIVPKPEEKALPEIDESEPATETQDALDSLPATEESAAIQGDVQEPSGESVPGREVPGEIPAVSDLDSKAAEIESPNVGAEEGDRERAVSSQDEVLKLDTASPHSDVSVTVVEPTPIEESGASIISPVAAELVIEPIREEEEPDDPVAEKEGDSQGFELVQESEPTEAKVIEESGETAAPAEEVPLETPEVLEPVKHQEVVDVSEEPSLVLNQQAEETNKDESPEEASRLTAPTDDSQTIIRENEAHIEGIAEETPRHAAVTDAVLETGTAALEESTHMSIPTVSTEQLATVPASVEEILISHGHDTPHEVTLTQEASLPDKPFVVSAVVPEDVPSTGDEEKDRNGEVGVSAENFIPGAGSTTETLPSKPATTTTAGKSHVHEKYIASEKEAEKVDTPGVPGVEVADIPSSEDALESSAHDEASGDRAPATESTIEQSIPAAVLGTSLISALEDQPSNLETTTAEGASAAEERSVAGVTGENLTGGSDEAEKVPSTEENLENVDVENITVAGVPMVDKTTVLQIPVIDSSEEPPVAPAAEVVSVPKVAIIDEEGSSPSEAPIHTSTADVNEAEVHNQSISIPKDEEFVPFEEAETAPAAHVPEVADEISAPTSVDNAAFGVHKNEAEGGGVNVEPAGTDAKSSDVRTLDDEVPHDSELHVEDATPTVPDAPTQEESVNIDSSIQSIINQHPVTSDSVPAKSAVAGESVTPPEASGEPSFEKPAAISQGVASEEPPVGTDKADSPEVIVTANESTDPTPVPIATTPLDIPERVESELADTHTTPAPESDVLQGSAEPLEQRFEEKQAEAPVDQSNVVDGTQSHKALHDLVAEPENETNSQLQHVALAAASIPLGDALTQSADTLSHNDAVVPEKPDTAAEPVIQIQDVAEPGADIIAEPAAQLEDTSAPDVEPEADTDGELAQVTHSSNEAQVAESKDLAVSQDLPIEEAVRPVVTNDTLGVGNETNDIAQSSVALKGETEPGLDLNSQPETTEPVKIVDEGKAEPEVILDNAQPIKEAEPKQTDSVFHDIPSEAEAGEATLVHEPKVAELSDAIGQDAIPEALEPSIADGNQEVPGLPVAEALLASEESGTSQALNDNTAQDAVEGSTDVHPEAVVDSDGSQVVEPIGDQIVPAVDVSKTEIPLDTAETVETSAPSSNLPISEETALSNLSHSDDIAPTVKPPSDEVQHILPAEDLPTLDPAITAENPDSVSQDLTTATAEAASQSVQPAQPSPSTQHTSDPAVTAESASEVYPPIAEEPAPSVKDVSDTTVESLEPAAVAAAEPEVQVPGVDEDHPIDTQFQKDQEPTSGQVPATVEPISEPEAPMNHQNTAILPSTAIADSQKPDDTVTPVAQIDEGISESAPIDGTHILAEDPSVPTPGAEEIVQSVETHREESSARDDVTPTELGVDSTAATEHQDIAHAPSATVDDQPLATLHSTDSNAEAPVVSDFAGDAAEAGNVDQVHDSSIQLEPAVQPQEFAQEPPAEPLGDPRDATGVQLVPSDDVEAEGEAASENVQISTEVEAKELNSGVNGENAETAEGTPLEEKSLNTVEAKTAPVDTDDTNTVSNERLEPSAAPVDETLASEPPSGVDGISKQVDPSSTVLLSSHEPEVEISQVEENASEDKAITADNSFPTRSSDNESPEVTSEQPEADLNVQHDQGIGSDSIPEVIEGIASQTQSQVEPEPEPSQLGAAEGHIPAPEELVVQSEDKPKDSEPATQIDDVQEHSIKTLDELTGGQTEKSHVQSASGEISSSQFLGLSAVESQEPSVNDESKSQLPDQPVLAENSVPSESVHTKSIEEPSVGVEPEGTDVATEPITQAQNTDFGDAMTSTTNGITGSAVQEQETFERKLEVGSTQVEQLTSEDPVQPSDALQEVETQQPLVPAASGEPQAGDVSTSAEIASSTEIPGEAVEPETSTNTVGTRLEDVDPEPEVTQSAETANPEPGVISNAAQGSEEAPTESTDNHAQLDAHSATGPIETTPPAHANELIESGEINSIEQHISEVSAEGQSGDAGVEAAAPAPVLPSTFINSDESRPVEITEDRLLPPTEDDVDATSAGANVETADTFAPNVSDGETTLQPNQSDVVSSSTEPSFVPKDDLTSEPVVGENLDDIVKALDSSTLGSSISNPEEVALQSNQEPQEPAIEEPLSKSSPAIDTEVADTSASNADKPALEEAASQTVQTDVPVPSTETPDEAQPSLIIENPSVPDQLDPVVNLDPVVDDNPNVDQSVQTDTAAPEPTLSTLDVIDSNPSVETAARSDPVVEETSVPVEEETDTQPVVPSEPDATSNPVPAAELEGTTSNDFQSSLVPAQEDEEAEQSQAPAETDQETEETGVNVGPNSEPDLKARAVPATEHPDEVLTPSIVISTHVEPGVEELKTVDEQATEPGALPESVETAGATAVDGTHDSSIQPDVSSSNVESEPVVEAGQESTSEPAAEPSTEVPIATDPEPIFFEGEDKALPANVSDISDVEAKGFPLDLDVSKTEETVVGSDNVAPSNGIAGTNGTVMNGGSVDADTEGNSEDASANQDQEDHTVPLDNGVDSGVLIKDVPAEGVLNLDEAIKEKSSEFLGESARQEEVEDK